MKGLELPTDPNLIVGLDRADDAGVYKISEDLALIQTVDFFTPIVDDPYWFGQIAAANALSDVYAMGGEPRTAMNLVSFPLSRMDLDVLRQILKGGLDKLREAETVLVGGHSVEDPELKYGLAVTGFVHPDRVLTKKNLQDKDQLILTKPLGTGIVNTAIKGGVASQEQVQRVTRLMAALNRTAARIMLRHPVHACTDVTGFGLLGHLAEMVCGSGHTARINIQSLPVLPEALEFASMGMVPGGAHRNRTFREKMVQCADYITGPQRDLLFDPQTSGGLLICCPQNTAGRLLEELHSEGLEEAAIVGLIQADPRERIHVE